MPEGPLGELEALKRRIHNATPRDIERVARRAGWIHDRTTGGHAIYIKDGFPFNLSIPLHDLKGWTAKRLLNLIESSLYSEGGEDD